MYDKNKFPDQKIMSVFKVLRHLLEMLFMYYINIPFKGLVILNYLVGFIWKPSSLLDDTTTKCTGIRLL